MDLFLWLFLSPGVAPEEDDKPHAPRPAPEQRPDLDPALQPPPPAAYAVASLPGFRWG